MADVVRRTVREDILEESRYLRSHGQARAALKEILEMPDAQVDRVMRAVRARLSDTLRKELPILVEAGLWEGHREGRVWAFEVGPRSDAATTSVMAGGISPPTTCSTCCGG